MADIPIWNPSATTSFESWTGQQVGDWWTAQGNEGNWYDPYVSTLNPSGTQDFDWSVYNTSPVAQMQRTTPASEVDWQGWVNALNAKGVGYGLGSYIEDLIQKGYSPYDAAKKAEELTISANRGNSLPVNLYDFVTTGEGGWEIGKIYPEAHSLYELRTQTPQDWFQQQGYNYQDISQSEPYQGLSGLLEQWQNPDFLNQQLGAANEYGAQNLGFESAGAYQDTLGNLQSKLDQIDFSGQLSEDQRIALSYDIQQVRQESMMMLEAMQASGRSSAALYKADEISSQIGDMYIQGKLKYMEANLARAQMEFSAISGRYESLTTQGLAQSNQYLEEANRQLLGSLQGYAMQLSTLAQQNSDYVDLYKQHADQVYQSIMADMGFDAHTLSMDQERWEQSMAAYLQRFEMQLASFQLSMQQQGLDMQQDAMNQQLWLGILDMLTGGLTSIFS